MYNVRKLKVFSAIYVLNNKNIPSTAKNISLVVGNRTNDSLTHYLYAGYLTGKKKKIKGEYRQTVFKLNDKGKSVFEKMLERKKAGYDLNIRRKPKPFDWSKIELLPGLSKLEELQRDKLK